MLDMLERKKTITIMHLEDNDTERFILKNFIKKRINNFNIIEHENFVESFLQIPLTRPDAIVVDWRLSDASADRILHTLRRYKGLVIIFSGYHKEYIKESILNEIGEVPSNFEIIEKENISSYHSVVDLVCCHCRDTGKI